MWPLETKKIIENSRYYRTRCGITLNGRRIHRSPSRRRYHLEVATQYATHQVFGKRNPPEESGSLKWLSSDTFRTSYQIGTTEERRRQKVLSNFVNEGRI